MTRALVLLYGLASYAFFLATFLYAIAFTGNVLVPKSIDIGGADGSLAERVLIDVLLLGVFAVQHSVMARQGFKRAWTKIVPKAVERSTFVLFASAAIALLCWQWRAIPDPVWTVDAPLLRELLHALFWVGFGLVLVATFVLNHFELFGLQQVVYAAMRRDMPQAQFKTPSLYRVVRHPIYLGFIIGFWSTPDMTVGHLLFAVATTGYIFIGIAFEERDLIAAFGDRYRQYRRDVGMLLPRPKARAAAIGEADQVRS